MADPAIRPATQGDLQGILALYRQLHPHDPILERAAAETAWSALLSSGLVTTIVAEVAGLVMSSCTLAVVPNLSRGARPYGVIENVVTDLHHRRAGLGHAVLNVAIETAWAANCYKIVLATGSTREATLKFYAGAGFDRGGKTYFEMRRP